MASISAILLIFPAFLRAPVDHVHVGGPQEHPHVSFLHSHVEHDLHEMDPHFGDADPDKSARSVNWFSPVCSPVLTFIAVLFPVASVDPVLVEDHLVERVEPRSHDPPSLRFTNPRSPPA
jgi:hypothetical protein